VAQHGRYRPRPDASRDDEARRQAGPHEGDARAHRAHGEGECALGLRTKLLKSGMSPMDIAKRVNCTPAVVYDVKARLGGGGSAPAKRGPSRPPKSASSSGDSGMDGLAGILDMVKNSDRERAALRTALEKIQAVIEGVLA